MRTVWKTHSFCYPADNVASLFLTTQKVHCQPKYSRSQLVRLVGLLYWASTLDPVALTKLKFVNAFHYSLGRQVERDDLLLISPELQGLLTYWAYIYKGSGLINSFKDSNTISNNNNRCVTDRLGVSHVSITTVSRDLEPIYARKACIHTRIDDSIVCLKENKATKGYISYSTGEQHLSSFLLNKRRNSSLISFHYLDAMSYIHSTTEELLFDHYTHQGSIHFRALLLFRDLLIFVS